MIKDCLLYESITQEGGAELLKCIICKSGFTMNKEGKCLLSQINDSNDSSDDNVDDESEFLEIKFYSLFIINMIIQFLI